MKMIFAVILGMAVATGAYAGSWAADGKDPHHGMKEGGCASKAKVARMKELYGEDWAKQHPDPKITEEAKKNKAKFKNLDKFI
jgi:hypothetical protein